MPTSHEVRERLATRDRFRLAEVRRWMADESDLELWAAVHDFGATIGTTYPVGGADQTTAVNPKSGDALSAELFPTPP